MHTYSPRAAASLDSIVHGDWELKRYSIVIPGDTFEPARFDAGVAMALGKLPNPAQTAERQGAGFMILHQGRGVDYLVLAWWDHENELPLEVFVRDQADGSAWREARDGESVCVWDLEIIGAERSAYVDTVLSGADDGRARYLARRATPGGADTARELLRHTLATLAYRGGKTLRNAPDAFARFRISPASRTPGEILAHVCDLMDWALWLARGEHRWRDSPPTDWNSDTTRFFAALHALDELLASGATVHASTEQLFQGPVADALTHVGQLAMLRRLAGDPIRGENYAKALISSGQVSAAQPAAVVEFDRPIVANG